MEFLTAEEIAQILKTSPEFVYKNRILLVYCLSNIFTIAFACAILGACGNQPISS